MIHTRYISSLASSSKVQLISDQCLVSRAFAFKKAISSCSVLPPRSLIKPSKEAVLLFGWI